MIWRHRERYGQLDRWTERIDKMDGQKEGDRESHSFEEI